MKKPRNRFFNRELSWLEFNQRVLDQASNPAFPLLERLKFLAITASNLDEFFMVRVGSLQFLEERNPDRRDPSGLTASQQLNHIGRRVRRMMRAQAHCYYKEIEPGLRAQGVDRVTIDGLQPLQRAHLETVFSTEIAPILSPIGLARSGTKTLLRNRELHLAVRLQKTGGRRTRLAVIPLPASLPRFITLPAENKHQFVLLQSLVAAFAGRLFPGEKVLESTPFRITRNADMGVREDMAYDLLSEMRAVLDARNRSACVRLEVAATRSETLLTALKTQFGVDDSRVYSLESPLNLQDFMALSFMDGHDELTFDPWPGAASPQVPPDTRVFDVLRERDVLLYHPYDSFDPVVRLVDEAADDPDVLAIKQVLYRTSKDSPIIAALARAAEKGKYVTVLLELKARFDEARNIEWARALEDAGVQVIYGVKRLKTHAKICLVVRREPDGLKRYMHFGTGNYNESTARLYTDISYMTSDAELGGDASAFFNIITGLTQPQAFHKLESSPIGLREKVEEMIAIEAEHSRQGEPARILAKVNSLVDPRIIDALYEASQAGVEIALNVRGICGLKPGIKGLSENITVTSIVDRYLEHARIFYFRHGGQERMFISSADWMPRNLDKRVETLVPVDSPKARQRLLHHLETSLADNVSAWQLNRDGSYTRLAAGKGDSFRSQEVLYGQAVSEADDARRRQRTVFEQHRPPRRK